jgi:hypothetical protein
LIQVVRQRISTRRGQMRRLILKERKARAFHHQQEVERMREQVKALARSNRVDRKIVHDTLIHLREELENLPQQIAIFQKALASQEGTLNEDSSPRV